MMLEKKLKSHDAAVVREAIRSKEFFEMMAMEHRERTEKAKEITEKIRGEGKYE